MASTAAGRALTERHRQQQLALRAATLRRVLAIWGAFDIANIRESWVAMEPALLAVVERDRVRSAEVAANYFRAYRMAEGVTGTAAPVLVMPDAAFEARAATSLRVTGPYTALRLTGLRDPRAATTALSRVSGAATRLVLEGGRETLLASVREESRQTGRRVGWQRVTDGSPCAFCAMLASRGAVYREETAGFQAHDACACTAEPVYRSEPLTGQRREWRELWNESTRGTRGQESLAAFRRAYEGRVA